VGIGAGEGVNPAVEAERRVLEGRFVRLRPLVPADAERTLAWRLDPRAHLLNRGAETPAQQRSWIERRPDSELNYVIERSDGVSLGMLSLVDIDFVNGRAEPARFLIGDEEAAKGIPAAVEAMKLLYEMAFDRLGLSRLYGTVVEDNTLMLTWQRYLGMREEGRLRRHLRIGGRLQDVVCLGLLENEYRTTSLPRMRALIAMAARPQPPQENER
jgi:diamine N-acetyltransferase